MSYLAQQSDQRTWFTPMKVTADVIA